MIHASGAAHAAHLFIRPGTRPWARRASGGVPIAADLTTATIGD